MGVLSYFICAIIFWTKLATTLRTGCCPHTRQYRVSLTPVLSMADPQLFLLVAQVTVFHLFSRWAPFFFWVDPVVELLKTPNSPVVHCYYPSPIIFNSSSNNNHNNNNNSYDRWRSYNSWHLVRRDPGLERQGEANCTYPHRHLSRVAPAWHLSLHPSSPSLASSIHPLETTLTATVRRIYLWLTFSNMNSILRQSWDYRRQETCWPSSVKVPTRTHTHISILPSSYSRLCCNLF